MPLISVTSGKENFPESATKVFVFAVATARHPMDNGTEVFLDVAARLGYGIERQGRPNRTPAASGYREDLGSWTVGQYHVQENTLIKVHANRSVRGRRSSANVFLQVRERAALRRVTVQLSGDHRADRSAVHAVEGRFDVLTVAQVRALQARAPEQALHFAQPAYTGPMFTITELAPEVSPRAGEDGMVRQRDHRGREIVTPADDDVRAIEL